MRQPYRLRTAIRERLPWLLINLGLAGKGRDCEAAGGDHEWYNEGDGVSACYHCRVVRSGELWRDQRFFKLTHHPERL